MSIVDYQQFVSPVLAPRSAWKLAKSFVVHVLFGLGLTFSEAALVTGGRAAAQEAICGFSRSGVFGFFVFVALFTQALRFCAQRSSAPDELAKAAQHTLAGRIPDQRPISGFTTMQALRPPFCCKTDQARNLRQRSRRAPASTRRLILEPLEGAHPAVAIGLPGSARPDDSRGLSDLCRRRLVIQCVARAVGDLDQ